MRFTGAIHPLHQIAISNDCLLYIIHLPLILAFPHEVEEQ